MGRIASHIQFLGYGLFSNIFKSKTVRHNGARFRMKTGTSNEVHRAMTFSHKEPEMLEWIDSFEPNSVFYDVGANVGVYSLYAAANDATTSVISFEPDGQSFASLCYNAHINRFKIAPYPFAISENDGVGFVRLSSMSAGAGACALGRDYLFIKRPASDIFTQGTSFTSLDTLIAKNGFPVPNYIKIDVDGIEEDIIRGASTTLSSPECRGLLVEFQYKTEDDVSPIIAVLAAFGLDLVSKSAWVSGAEGLTSRNFVFKKRPA